MPKYYNGCPSVVELVIFICFLLISFFFLNFLMNFKKKIIAERDLGEGRLWEFNKFSQT